MNPPAARPQPAVPAPATPVAVHCLNWQQALLDLPASATAAQRDAVVASWAQRCWHDLCAALPQQQHVVLAHPGQLHEQARICMVAQQASGWLYSPLHPAAQLAAQATEQTTTGQAPRWQTNSSDLLQQHGQRAAAAGFGGAEIGLHAAAAVFAALDDVVAPTSISPSMAAGWQRRHFPLLGTPRAHAFAPMPATLLQAQHSHGLYAVMGDADWTIRCMQLGVKLVQLRIKQAAPEVIDAQITRCAQAAHQLGALLIINDHWQAAVRHAQHMPGIYGVHLGQDDAAALREDELDTLQASGLRLGVSSQTLWQLARALRLRPSYIACGPIHATATKDIALPPVGENNLRFWAQILHSSVPEQAAPALPLVAIGGMNPERAQAAAAAGADSVAVVSNISAAADPAQAIAALQQAIAAGLRARNAA